MRVLLELSGVGLEVGGRTLLAGVDLELRRGEVMALVGPNGVGKTTLLRTVTGLRAPAAGEILLAGRDPRRTPRRELARLVAVVPQETAISLPFTALEVVLMGRAPHLPWLGFESETDLEHARQVLRSLGVAELALRPMPDLSGGERQLVVLARALAQAAPLLLLDEPTAALDLRHRLLALTRIRAHVEGGGAALVVTHDLDLAARFCDRILLLGRGRPVSSGPPEEVLTPVAIARAYGVEARVVAGPDGRPVVLPRLPREEGGASAPGPGP